MAQAVNGQGQLVARLFGILEAFSPKRPSLTLSDLSRCTGLPVATVHRLAAQLVSFGALERQTDGRYGIGIRLWEIGLVEPRGLELREAARPLLFRLHERRRYTVSLTVLDRTETVVIEAPHRGGLGRRAPAQATAAGRMLLAYAADANHLGAPDHRVMDEIRRTGIAVDDGHRSNSPFALAVPVRAATASVVAALSVEGPAAARDPKLAAGELRETADAIHCALRRRPDNGQLSPRPSRCSTQRKGSVPDRRAEVSHDSR